MRQSPMLNYPAAEFEARMADAARKVREAGLDCIMGTSKMVVCHLTGLRSVVWKSKVSTPGLLFLCADGRYGLVCSYGGIEAAMYSICLEREDFYSYDYSGRRGVADNFFGALCYTLRHFGIDTGRLGCEFGPGIHPHMDIAMLDALRAEFPEMECVNAADLVWNILADKSEAQLADLREAEGINARAVSLGLEGLQPGVTTEMELYKAIARQGYLNGSEHFTYMSLVSGPERALCVDCPASAAVIPDAPGTVIRVEGGAMRAELNAPFTAKIVVGGVQPEQKPAWQLAQGMIESAMAAVKPGARACDIAEAMDARAAAQGRSGWVDRPGFAGSGMGWGRIDGPLLVRSNTFTLRAGMTLSLQASVRHSSVGLLILRQNVVVTEGGCAYLRGKTYDPLVI